jgi:hypothetical protein
LEFKRCKKSYFGINLRWRGRRNNSCGNDRQRDNGLNTARMLKDYGGKQPKMHSTKMKQHQGYLGTYPAILSIHDNQDMVFSLTDEGPCWRKKKEQLNKRKDKVLMTKRVRNFTKKELQETLKARNINLQGSYLDLKKFVTNNGIPFS